MDANSFDLRNYARYFLPVFELNILINPKSGHFGVNKNFELTQFKIGLRSY